MSSDKTFNTNIIAIIALVVIAIGGLTYYKTQGKETTTTTQTPPQQTAAATTGTTQNAETPEAIEIKPGNPVVATVNGTEIKRLDVLNFIQTLPPQTRQASIGQLFPVALEQVVANKVIADKTEGVNLDRDPEVRKQLELAKKNIVRNVYLQKEVTKQITDERIQKAYEQYVANFPEINEIKARHILVEDKAKARELIKQLEGGADFAELAKEHSTDQTAENGGMVGYFAENEVVEPFAQAAFALDIDEYTKTPVQTDFGYHVIQTLEKRKRPAAELEQVKPFLEAQLRNVFLGQIVQGWVGSATVEKFDINGDTVKETSTATATGQDAANIAPAAGG